MRLHISFVFFVLFFKKGFSVALDFILELALVGGLALNSEIHLPLPPWKLGLKVCTITAQQEVRGISIIHDTYCIMSYCGPPTP